MDEPEGTVRKRSFLIHEKNIPVATTMTVDVIVPPLGSHEER